MSRRWASALVLVVPLLLGAKDPRGDVITCDTRRPASGPDLVAVRGTATELGTVGVWRLTFDLPIEVPSDLQIDVLVRDPRLPPGSVGDERGMNRIVRWEAASVDQPLEIIWLPHDGSTSFNPPEIRGRTLTLVAPGRLLLGENVNGTESVERARWSVVVRADGACDRLGTGVPVERLRSAPSASSSPVPSGASVSPAPNPTPQQPSILRVPWALLLIAPVAVGIWMLRRRSPEAGSSSGHDGTKLPNGHG